MSPSHSTKGNRRYRYYICTNALKTGWSNCPSKSIPALEIEKFVVQQIRSVGADPSLISATLEIANKHAKEELANLDSELASLKKDVKAWTKELPTATAGRQADLHERMSAAEKRATELHEARATVLVIDPQQVAEALTQFDRLWSALTPAEQTQVMELLIERVDYDGSSGRIVVSFNPAGILAFGRAA